MKAPESERFRRVVYSEIDNLKQLHESLDLDKVNRAVELLHVSSAVYVVGSRLSYTFAYYLGWSLTKIRTQVHIMRGSDSTCIAFLTIAPAESLVVIFATTRYPNELIRLGKVYSNLMVDMHPSNVKLRGRAVRMLRDAVAVDEARARELLS